MNKLLNENLVAKLIKDASSWCLHTMEHADFNLERLEAYKRLKEYNLLQYKLEHIKRGNKNAD